MPSTWPLVVIGALGAGLLLWKLTTRRGRTRNLRAVRERLGFQPCLDETSWLEQTIAGIENNQGFRYEVREPQRWSTEPPVYTYEKVRYPPARSDVEPATEQEILFPLRRPPAGAIAVTVKPSSLAVGAVTRMIGAVASGPWDSRPDDLHPLELPVDLQGTNLVGALGPPGARFHDLVGANMTSVMQSLGDAGGIFVRARNGWCIVAGNNSQIPFRLDEILARIRPLLGSGQI